MDRDEETPPYRLAKLRNGYKLTLSWFFANLLSQLAVPELNDPARPVTASAVC